MGDVLLTLAIVAAAAWLAVALYFGFEAEVDAISHRPRSSRGGAVTRRGRRSHA